MMNKPAVAIITNNYFPTIGGITTYINNLKVGLEERGAKVLILKGPATQRKVVYLFRWLFYSHFVLMSLIKILFMKMKNKNIIVHSHSANYCLLLSFLAKAILKKKAVHTFHTPIAKHYESLKILTPKIDELIYVSHATKALYNYYGVPHHRSESIIPGGISVKSYPNKPRELSNEIVVLFVGRIAKEKGIIDAIKAIQILDNCTFRVVGIAQTKEQNIYENDIVNLIKTMNLEKKVFLLGKIQGLKLIREYEKAHIFICPSLWEEPAPMVIAEALASGLPIVAYNTGGLKERIIDGKNGMLVEKGNIKELAKAIKSIFCDNDRYYEMSLNARKFAEENLDRSLMVDRHLKIYLN